MPVPRGNRSLTVFLLLLFYLNSSTSSKLDVPEEQLMKRNRVPVIFVDFFAEDFSEDAIARTPKSEFDKQEAQFEKAIQAFVKKNKELQQQEDIIRPEYAKIDDDGLAHEMKKKESVIETEHSDNGAHRTKDFGRRTDSSSYEEEVDFDDVSIQSRRPSHSGRHPHEISEVSGEVYDRNVPQEKPSLVLTHGGYQNPHDEKQPGHGHPQTKSRRKKGKKHVKKDEHIRGRNEGGANYDIYPPPVFQTVPGMGYAPPLTSMFSNSPIGYGSGMISPYPGFSDHPYLYSTPLMDYYMGRLPGRGISGYPSPVSGGFYRSPGERNIPVPQRIPTNYLPAGSPFDTESRLPYTEPPEQSNSYENPSYQFFDDAPRNEPNVSPPFDNTLRTGGRRDSSPSYYGGSPAEDLNQSPGSYPYYEKYDPSPYGPPTSYVEYPSSPQSASGSASSSEESMGTNKQIHDSEQKSDSLSLSQAEQDNPPVHNSNEYLNYPTEDAGYGVVEQLPTRNGTVTKSKQTPLSPPIHERGYPALPRYVPSDMLYRQRLYYGTNFPSFTSTSDKDLSRGRPAGGSNNSNTKQNNTFDAEQYFKNLRSSINNPFGQASPPVIGNDPFIDYPKRQVGRTSFHRPIFPAGRDVTPGGSQKSYPFDFLETGGRGSGSTINPDIVPECAKKENSTICFEDAEYPKNEIQYILNSEALLIQRLLTPTNYQGFIGLENNDADTKTSDSEDICKVNINYGQPLRAADVDGKWKIVVNTEKAGERREFSQSVRLETCSNPGDACSHTDKSVETHCVQKHSLHRLLVWDHDNGLHMALFKLNTACACQIVQTRSV